MEKQFSIITANVIRHIAKKDPGVILDAVLKAYLLHHSQDTICPKSHFMWLSENKSSRIIALPAALCNNPRIAGIKWISSNPQNISRGLERASAVVILNDFETGYPFVCMEGSAISSLRTAYSALLAIKYLSNRLHINNLGIVGTGYIAKTFCESLKQQGYRVSNIHLFDKNVDRTNEFKVGVSETFTSSEVFIEPGLKEVISKSEIIVLTTTTKEPYIDNIEWLQHNPIILNISLRDLAPEVLLASNNIVDDLDHVLCANTSPHLAQQKYGHTAFINGTLGQLIHKEFLMDDTKPIIFSPMGMGILDISVAYAIYEKANQEEQLIAIPEFFGA